MPIGRLSLSPSLPVMNADITSATLYCHAYKGDTDCDGQSLSLAGMAPGLYDIYNNNGTLVFSPPWTGSVPPLTETWVNGWRMSSLGTYAGTIAISVAGQATCHFSYGQSRKFELWNNNHRLPITLKGGDNSGAWVWTPVANYPLGPIGGVNGGVSSAIQGVNNNATVLIGRPEERASVTLDLVMRTLHGAGENTTNTSFYSGIGWGITSAIAGFDGDFNNEFNTSQSIYLDNGASQHSAYSPDLFQGSVTAYAIGQANSNVNTWLGVEGNLLLIANYRG
jgi:hypothetical protein